MKFDDFHDFALITNEGLEASYPPHASYIIYDDSVNGEPGRFITYEPSGYGITSGEFELEIEK